MLDWMSWRSDSAIIQWLIIFWQQEAHWSFSHPHTHYAALLCTQEMLYTPPKYNTEVFCIYFCVSGGNGPCGVDFCRQLANFELCLVCGAVRYSTIGGKGQKSVLVVIFVFSFGYENLHASQLNNQFLFFFSFFFFKSWVNLMLNPQRIHAILKGSVITNAVE